MCIFCIDEGFALRIILVGPRNSSSTLLATRNVLYPVPENIKPSSYVVGFLEKELSP